MSKAMLAAYNATLERAAGLLKELGVPDGDPKQATPDQINAVVAILLAPHVGNLKLTTKQLLADHRKLTRLKRKQVS